MVGLQIGNFRLEKELGRGAFGTVFEAQELFDGKFVSRVAVKIIAPQSAAHRDSILNELVVLANIKHPNVIAYRTFGVLPPEMRQSAHEAVEGDAPGWLDPVYIALEFGAGGTLSIVYAQNQMSPRELLELALEAAQGLEFLAREGVTHRDIKPDNILRCRSRSQQTWKISDLGLAHPTRTDGRESGAAGTMLYMAPEAWRGVVSPSVDVWALGLCLHEAATRTRMWNEAAPGALEFLICEEEPPLELDLLPLVLRDIVRGALERSPTKRWSAAQIARRAKNELDSLREAPQNALVVSQGGGGAFASFKDALANAPEGVRVAVLPGHYAESVVIEQSCVVTGFDPNNKEARALVHVECGVANALKITMGEVRLENLSFRGTGEKKFHVVSIQNARVTFRNCAFASDSLAGVFASKGARVEFFDCHFEGGPTDAVAAQDGAQIQITGGQIHDFARGVSLKTGAALELNGTHIASCRDSGIHSGDETRIHIVNAQISGCGVGINLGEGANASVQGGKISGNAKHALCAARRAVATVERTDARGNGFGAWEVALGARVARPNTLPD